MFRKEKRFNKEFVFSLLMWSYLFSVLDLLTTYYIELNFNSVEMSPVYHVGGWFLLVMLKVFVPLLFVYYTYRFRTYTFMYIFVFINVFVVFSNILQILFTLK